MKKNICKFILFLIRFPFHVAVFLLVCPMTYIIENANGENKTLKDIWDEIGFYLLGVKK